MYNYKRQTQSERLSFKKLSDVKLNVCKHYTSKLNVMSSSRVVRGTKGRIILCVFVIIAITILIACFNNVLSQLDDTKRAHDQCHQQQENLSTQLQGKKMKCYHA